MTSWADLSCYTSNLAAYLAPERPRLRAELAGAVRLAVRPETTAVSHHRRIDDGRLAYRGADHWPDAEAALVAEQEAYGAVLAVANTARLPWSPGYRTAAAPHWVLLTGRRGGRWSVADHFAATTPLGEHPRYAGQVSGAELAALLAPVGTVPAEVANRDRYALGAAVPVPPASAYRWLTRTGGAGLPAETGWLTGPDAIAHLAVLATEPARLAALVDDLWAASRHQLFRYRVRSADGLTDPAASAAAEAAWAELPRALRFAVQSARRGRPRPGVVRAAFDRIAAAEVPA
ncbi:hypothetical protein ACTOB_003514 [Actinoplanes oblitus]|uniref:Uncharacterized protein n=1 Tax=Actinoplanes oblitus TaxID=3040509 RepID=A0ABY8WPQ0_9ACTN|nr:hypothetical protein [Actinoplanes oblitus]WIM99849.1 hypothetical protein ACTOB_003514 [Actinoplanes oblitus]